MEMHDYFIRTPDGRIFGPFRSVNEADAKRQFGRRHPLLASQPVEARRNHEDRKPA